MLYPMKTNPVFKQYIWGGKNLKSLFHKDIPDDFAAESWEVSAHPAGECKIANGAYRGVMLSGVTAKLGDRFWGTALSGRGKFPLLIKLLDANDRLSVQVHPDDSYANIHENGENGKNEMWYVLAAKPDAQIACGFKRDTSRQEYEDAIANGTLEELLNFISVKPGDCFYIPAGTVHAIGAGIVIAEVQQSSDATYRVYDYNRRDAQGNLRELHIEKAVDVSNLSRNHIKIANAPMQKENSGLESRLLCDCPNFRADFAKVEETAVLSSNPNYFEILLFAEGEGKLWFGSESMTVSAGETVLIPAQMGKYQIEGKCGFLKIHAK
jgi:mannose-6-phosphate isomerase